MAIVLASSSPRRQDLLTQVGCKFIVVSSDYEENNQCDIEPKELAVLHASAKARDVAKIYDKDTVIGADTIVVLDGEVYGKPKDADDAKRMLRKLSGREHEVITGIAVFKDRKLFADYAVTKVKIRPLDSHEIDNYVATKEPLDKAGAYGIQEKGALLVEKINGCYYNVVGLPLVHLEKLLNRAGESLLC